MCRQIGVKKTMLTSVGKVEIANSNPQSEGNFGFQMSPYLQETAVFVGQENTYERGDHTLKKNHGSGDKFGSTSSALQLLRRGCRKASQSKKYISSEQERPFVRDG